MLKIDSESLRMLKSCIGKKIYAIFSDRINFSELEVSFPDRKLRISFYQDCSFEIGSDFFETDEGQMFHDYFIRDNKPYKEGLSGYILNSNRISKIEIYGRLFPIEDFQDYSDIYNKFRDVNKTDDLFMFYLVNGERIMIVMDDCLPEINLYVGTNMIDLFFKNTGSIYSLHYTI